MSALGETWAVVEVMGHQRHAGRVSQVRRFGADFCQVEVPHGDTFELKLLGAGSIFRVSFCTEADARAVASMDQHRNGWPRPQLPAPAGHPDVLDDGDIDDIEQPYAGADSEDEDHG